MKIVAQILGQTIGSTNLDSQGEKIPKRILERIARSGRISLSQNHQPEKPSIGYMENFHIVPDSDNEGEWLLKADVYFTKEPDDIEIELGGFSWSITELIDKYKAEHHSDYAIYLPHPYYTNKQLLDNLYNEDKNLSLGRWYKKSADPATITLAVSFILFVLSPAWSKFFDNIIWPKIKELFEKIPYLRQQGIQRTDFVQIFEINHHQTSVYFIPEAMHEKECYSKENLKKGYQTVIDYANNDHKSTVPGYHVIKLYWDKSISAYKLFHIEYKDGTVGNIL